MQNLFGVLAGALLLAAAPAAASSTDNGLVTEISSWRDGYVLFKHNGNRFNRASCQPLTSSSPQSWAISTITAAGQAQLALLLSAHALKKPVSIVGINACNVRADVETVDYMATSD